MTTHHSIKDSDALVPLQKWIESEAKKQSSAGAIADSGEKQRKKELILRKTTIAFGITELLRHARDHHCADSSALSLGERLSIDNFVVRVSRDTSSAAACRFSQRTWNDIKGVDMISPQISMDIVEPSFLCNDFSYDGGDVNGEERMGRYLEAEFPTLPHADGITPAVSQSEEDASCYSLGVILYELFSHLFPLPGRKHSIKRDGPKPGFDSHGIISQEPAHKKSRLLGSTSIAAQSNSSAQAMKASQEEPYSAYQKTPYFPLQDLGFPSSICLLVRNLLECEEEIRPHNAYDSLETVSKDLHLLLLDPYRFLFNHESMSEKGNKQLLFRKHKLYGRENQVSLITDAFCRVSSGNSEAFFIGGFSGSGKSRLVNSLTARVDIAEGYVLTRKFDQMSKERSLLEVISVLNELCLLIKEKRSQNDLLAIVKDLKEVFGTDFSILARLLPNIESISPKLNEMNHGKESDDQINLRSVCFILQRLMRVVSSKSHPVMIFLDDIHWCDNSALTLIEGILCDMGGSSCLFFVGSFRSNEVEDDHGIFRLIDNLSSFGTPTTKLSLEGLNPEDLNTMISDTMCIFPRICEPLSDIVFQKTKGNPFFVLEFLKSLVDGGLLEYSAQKRRWVWDEDRISSMDITGNVLHLLSSKMSGLLENTQLALKVASCFGIKIKESVVGHLSTNSEYFNIESGLKHAVAEGFMVKVATSDFKFVHDKVQEAAYSLIPDNEKNQYHYSLGMSIYSTINGRNVDDLVFSIADQINRGVDSSAQSPEIRLEVAKINEIAGVKAMDCSDHVTAHSYLNIALAMLPIDHWKSHYDLTLQLSFLLAKSAYSFGDMEKADDVLQKIISEAHCLSDKLDAYHLVVLILFDRGAAEEAYTTVYEVLLQLGESIPRTFGQDDTRAMIKHSDKMLMGLSEESLMRMKKMKRKAQNVLKFYSCITVVAFLFKPSMVPFFSCRMVQLTMQHGICKYSLLGFVHYAAIGCSHDSTAAIQETCAIGKLAMTVLKHFDSSTGIVPRLFCIYYGYVASYLEPLHSCADNLLRGFECGIACGDTSSAFLNAIHHIRFSLFAGIDLPTLLKRTEYFLEVTERHGNAMAKTFLLLYRDTISILTGNSCNDYSEVQENALKFPAALFHKATRAFWMDHSERCHHFFEKMLQCTKDACNINNAWGVMQGRRFFMLLYGINSFKVVRRKSSQKVKEIPYRVLKVLKISAGCSGWNFRNKVYLLEAEIFSSEGRNEEAIASYAASITSARCSRFVAEQGLACERAGFHCKKIADNESAVGFFTQAKQCYAEWGSQMKVDSITGQLETFKIPLAGN